MSNDEEKQKPLFGRIRDVFVKDGDPNSPHLLFGRMNNNILGDDGDHKPEPTESDKKRKEKFKEPEMFSEDNFERLIYGDSK